MKMETESTAKISIISENPKKKEDMIIRKRPTAGAV